MTLLLLLLAVPDPIVRVVVFPDRAHVTRRQSVACGEAVEVRFAAIPPAAEAQSLRAHSSEGTVDALRVEERVSEQEFAPQVAAVDADIRKLEQSLAEVADARTSSDDAARLAREYAAVATQAIGREMALGKGDLKGWTTALDFVSKTLFESSEQNVIAQGRQRELNRRLAELRTRRQRLGDALGRRELVATALLSCPAGKTAGVELTYTVGGASWRPAYEARARDPGNSVELSTYATLVQTTGEDWNQAQVILSTALPRQNATPPVIVPLKVWAEEREPPRKVLASHEEYLRHAEDGAGAAADGNAGNRMKVADEGISVRLTVPEPADVKGDGTPARLLVGRHALRATFRYRAAPKWTPFVFRVGELSADTPFPLLPGPIDVYRRGDFVARYELERVPAGARFYLTFGLEDSLRVTRTILEEVVRDRRRHRYAYRFDLANYVGRPEEIELDEQIPVSELDDVKVEIDGRTTTGYRVADGIVAWRVALRPGERRTLELRYHVDAPASYVQ